ISKHPRCEGDLRMSESVNLPALGESVTEGTVTRWLKQVGDRVEIDEPLLEVSTDKVDTEIPSPVAGIIEAIHVQEDETVEVGAPLVTIGTGTAAGQEAGAGQEPGATSIAATPVAEAGPVPEPITATPVVGLPTAAPTFAAPTVDAPTAAPIVNASAAAPTVNTPPPTPPPPPPPAPPLAAPAGDAPTAAPIVTASAPAPTVNTPAATVPAATVATPVAATPSTDDTVAPDHPPFTGVLSGLTGYVTPIVRKLANEQGVDLTDITGTGVGGRIRKQDIIAAHAANSAAEAASLAPTGGSGLSPVTVAAGASSPREALTVSPLRGTTAPMTRLRKVVAERAVASMTSTAQLTSVVEVDLTRVAQLRDQVKGAFAEKTGNKLSYLPFFALAAAEALRAYPIINSTVDGDSIVYPAYENMSIAVDTERGLLTPVIRNAGDLNIAQLAAQIADLATRTRNNQLKPDELSGGTFTLTNTGSRGALFDTPVVFLPQSAILGTGVVVRRPVVVAVDGSDSIAVRSMVYLALSYDHRIIDGADAARFLTAVKARLEEGAFQADLGV